MKCGGRGSVGPGEKKVVISRSQYPLCRVCKRRVDQLEVDDSDFPDRLSLVALCHGRVVPVNVEEDTMIVLRLGGRATFDDVFAAGDGTAEPEHE